MRFMTRSDRAHEEGERGRALVPTQNYKKSSWEESVMRGLAARITRARSSGVEPSPKARV